MRAREIVPLSQEKTRDLFWLSPMTVWSMTPVLEPEMLPVNSVCAEDQPLALVGSLEVL